MRARGVCVFRVHKKVSSEGSALFSFSRSLSSARAQFYLFCVLDEPPPRAQNVVFVRRFWAPFFFSRERERESRESFSRSVVCSSNTPRVARSFFSETSKKTRFSFGE